MRNLLTLLLCITMLFSLSAFPCNAASYAVYSVEDAYTDFKAAHPDFVQAFTEEGIDEALLISFLYDIHSYIVEINEHTPVTENNFEENALHAISNISSREKYYPIQDALLILYPDAIRLALKEGLVSPELQPIIDTIKKIAFENNLIGNTSSGSGGETGGSAGSSNNNSALPDTDTSLFAFSDLPSSHWAYSAVNVLAENFILNGYLDGTFKPEANITRGEFAKIIVSATNTLDASATAVFKDVQTEDWYYYYVASAYNKGFIKGYEDGSFRPNDYITRADICTIVSRALGSPASVAGTLFEDDRLIASYAKIPVYALVRMGIINGMGDGTFAPNSCATRAQTAKIIYSAFFN